MSLEVHTLTTSYWEDNRKSKPNRSLTSAFGRVVSLFLENLLKNTWAREHANAMFVEDRMTGDTNARKERRTPPFSRKRRHLGEKHTIRGTNPAAPQQ